MIAFGATCSDMKKLFDRAYTKLVFVKVRFYGFDLGMKEAETSWSRGLKTPKLIKKQGLKSGVRSIE